MSKLVKCRTCEKEVAKKVKICPHCGEKKPTKKKSDFKTAFLVVIIFIILVAVFGPSKEEKLAEQKKQLAEKQQQIAQLLAEVKKMPSDQYSENYYAYMQLSKLDPNNQKYIKKIEHYKKRHLLAESIAKTCRIEARKRNKASLNNPQTYKSVTYYDKWDSGIYYFQEEFMGKNAFGVETKLVSKYQCSINKNKTVDIEKIFMRKAN